MFGRKEDKAKKRRTPRENLSQFGFIDMNFDGNMGIPEGNDDANDEDLEAELLALTSDSSASKPKRARPKVMPQVDLDRMIQESLKDVEVDDDESLDEDDPELLDELNELTQGDEDQDQSESTATSQVKEKPSVSASALLSILEERLKMYQTAESNAKAAGETARARRFARGSKTLTEQLRTVRNGGTVKDEDIPPPVATRAGGSAPSTTPSTDGPAVAQKSPETTDDSPATAQKLPETTPSDDSSAAAQKSSEDSVTTPPSHSLPSAPDAVKSPPDAVPVATTPTVPASYDPEVISKLEERRSQYRQAAVAAKRAGNKQDALKFAQIVKQFDIVIQGVKAGEQADLSEMPPPPDELQGVAASASSDAGHPGPIIDPPRVEDEHQTAEAPPPMRPPAVAAEPVPVPKTVLEALTQRLELYQKQAAAAKADGNSRKERQMGRIVKQYLDAIKRHKAGLPFAADELPTPPGYAPIPVAGLAASSSPAQPQPPAADPIVEKAIDPSPDLVPSKPAPAIPATPQPPTRPSSEIATPGPAASGPSSKADVRKSPASRLEKQMADLLARQKEFKDAALQAKNRGEMNQAREYLRHAKGFDKLIEATQNGLPVDLKTLPIPPSAKVELDADFDIINSEDCVAGTDDEIYEKLLQDLHKQVQTCMTTRDHFKAVGDVASANRFENMAVHSKKDMIAVKHAYKRKDPVPKFHYETKVFSIVQCCTDLMDNDLELTIIQGINYNVANPKDIDTYVRFELPWPSAEEPQKDRTILVKDTNNPVYDGKFTLQIQRNVRACQRIFKRHAIKCEVWSRGGFFRSDSLIGTVNIKLQPLESQCIIHDSFDLMDGRKAVGGKLEVKVRVRSPIVTKQVEEVTEKWLVVDNYHK